jgi:hypothetical protein
MSELGLVVGDFTNRNNDDSEQTQHAKALRDDAQDVEYFRDNYDCGVKRVEYVEEEHEVAREGLQDDLDEEQREEHVVDLSQQLLRDAEYFRDRQLEQHVDRVH